MCSRWTWRWPGGWGGASMAKPPLWGPGWSAASTMPTADQVIGWGTTLLIVLTGIVDAYRKWRAAHGPPSDEVARLRDENAWLWRELVRLRHLLGEAEADDGAAGGTPPPRGGGGARGGG